jgi:four helix bundle protein
MLRIYVIALGVLTDLRAVIEAIERRDADLARQIRRASSSVVLNIAEGDGSRGKNRTVRYHTALGSTRETLACIRVGIALGYIDEPNADLFDRIDRIAATLFRLVS